MAEKESSRQMAAYRSRRLSYCIYSHSVAVVITFFFALLVGETNLCRYASANPPRDLSNFQNNYRCDLSTFIARPSSYEQIVHLVTNHKKLQAVGVGHSWNQRLFCPKVTDDSVGITMTSLPQHIRVNTTDMTVLVSAGITQRYLLDYLATYETDIGGPGYTIPAFSWFIDQTMGGAIATDTHGSSTTYGSLSGEKQLLELWLLVANGTVVHLSDEINPHLMRAARVHTGRLGVNLFMKFRIVTQQPVKRTSQKFRPMDFANELVRVQEEYKQTGNVPKIVDELQYFWFVQTSVIWRTAFERVDPNIAAFSGPMEWPEGIPHPPGNTTITSGMATTWRAPRKLTPKPEISTAGPFGLTNRLATNAWERYFHNEFLANGVYSARYSYLSMTEEFKEALVDENPYDQYEFAIPLETAGDCMKGLVHRIYRPFQRLDDGFRTSALVRFVSEVDAYLSLTQGGPHIFINLEDYVYYNNINGSANRSFMKVIEFLKEDKRCKGSRLHWGKAGWPADTCDRTSEDFPNTWCHFGCAVQELDPHGRFKSESSVFRWNQHTLKRCCSSKGFDYSRSGCGRGCETIWPLPSKLSSRQCAYPPKHPLERYPSLW